MDRYERGGDVSAPASEHWKKEGHGRRRRRRWKIIGRGEREGGGGARGG